MHISPILSPSGRHVFVAGQHAWKQHTKRGFVASLEWMDIGRRTPSACLAIWPEQSILASPDAEVPGMWVIDRSELMPFCGFTTSDKATGTPSEYCLRQCAEALPMLGKDRNDKQALLALADVVMTYLPDLVLMPPAPKSVRQAVREASPVMWDIKAVNMSTGQTISEASV